jgi:hypothetical protein
MTWQSNTKNDSTYFFFIILVQRECLNIRTNLLKKNRYTNYIQHCCFPFYVWHQVLFLCRLL